MENARTGQTLAKTPESLPATAVTPYQENIGPVRDIPPSPMVR
jgi:hypothetical protein